ncbi:MAG: (2Fe-2S)-binding protein [Candidatus Thermoplasmatota archaeon]|nr:(2Fe-2S)-binding protein [Candidatus Thermoplasmatota archaeon]MDI6855965.1 (2Fe-2S)-binding protein [Candidatus Thermoplasmatota archaeon]
MKREIIICRCEDVTEQEVINAIDTGIATLQEIKKYLRCGMGLCQGRNCLPLIAKIIAKRTGKKLEEIEFPTARPLVKPIPLGAFRSENEKL